MRAVYRMRLQMPERLLLMDGMFVILSHDLFGGGPFTLKCMTFRAPLRIDVQRNTCFVWKQCSTSLTCNDVLSFYFPSRPREKQTNQPWQFEQRAKRVGKKFAKEDGETTGDLAGNRKRAKDARSSTARAESRRSPRFVELALAELSVRWSASKPSFPGGSACVWCAMGTADVSPPALSRARRNDTENNGAHRRSQ